MAAERRSLHVYTICVIIVLLVLIESADEELKTIKITNKIEEWENCLVIRTLVIQ